MFSHRTTWNRTENRLSVALATRRAVGARLLDLTESNPTRVGIPYPSDLLEALALPEVYVYDPDPRGARDTREAVAADFARRGHPLSADRIVLTASTSEAYSLLFKLLCDPGDAVLAPRPSYPLFHDLARLDAVRLESYPTVYDGEWHTAVGSLTHELSPRTRALLAVNPNNPTGAFLKDHEVGPMMELCAAHAVALIADEVFADYPLVGDPRRVSSLAGDGPALVFSLGGLSKSCGLPQLKLGWIGVSGPEALRQEALSRLEIAADTYLSVGTPVQRAAPSLLARLPELQAPIARRIETNLQALEARVGHESRATLLRPEGGWYAVLRVPATCSEEDRTIRLLEEQDVLVHPGYFYDFDSEAYLALSLLPEPETFSAGLAGILKDVERY